MKPWTLSLLLLLTPCPFFGADGAAAPSPSATATPAAAHVHAWMEGSRLLVSGSSLGLLSEKEARFQAVQEAAKAAGEFLEKKGLGQSLEIRQGVENAVLRETPLAAENFGDIKIEDVCQERWNGDNGNDRWSMHLTLSIRIGKRKPSK
jgi:hypothetical protein